MKYMCKLSEVWTKEDGTATFGPRMAIGYHKTYKDAQDCAKFLSCYNPNIIVYVYRLSLGGWVEECFFQSGQ